MLCNLSQSTLQILSILRITPCMTDLRKKASKSHNRLTGHKLYMLLTCNVKLCAALSNNAPCNVHTCSTRLCESTRNARAVSTAV